MKKRLFGIIVLALAMIQTHAQDALFHAIGMKGMADRYVQAITQDSDGYMWFATLNGLCRYDGYTIRSYGLSHLGENSNGLEDVKEDGGGNLWIKKQNRIFLFDKTNDRITSDIPQKLGSLGMPQQPDMIFIDADKDLWCLTDKMLQRYHFGSYSSEARDFINIGKVAPISLVCRNGEGYVLGKDGCLYQIDWGNRTLKKEVGFSLPRDEKRKIYLDTRGWIWNYQPHEQQYAVYNTHTRSMAPENETMIGNHFLLTNIQDDGKGVIWLSTDNSGVISLDIANHQMRQFTKEQGNPFSLPTNHIPCIYIGRNNILWIGTAKMGVAYSRLDVPLFVKQYLPMTADVKDFLDISDDCFLLCLDGEGLAIYNRRTEQYTVYSTQKGNSPSDIFICSTRRKDGTILLGTYGNGIAVLQDAGVRIWNDHPTFKYVSMLEEDHLGNLWVGTFMKGLTCIDSQGNCQSYDMDNSAISTNSITDIKCYQGNILLIATGYGLFQMDVKTRRISPVKGNKGDVLAKTYIGCITIDSRNLLWIGTRRGLFVYDLQRRETYQMTKTDGLSDNNVIAITEDQQHRMWITSEYGITLVKVVLDKNERLAFRCSNFYAVDGLTTTTFNTKAMACLNDGNLYMGTPDGYIKIDPTAVKRTKWNSQVFFTGLQIGEQIISPQGDIDLSYDENDFSVELSCLNYGEEHRISYLYRINHNGEWQHLEGNRINFNQLSPGKYHLEVKVSGQDDDSQISRLLITIHHPWWWSWPLRIVYLLVIGALIYAYMERKKKRELTEAKMNFFTNISHDLRTPLSLILIPVEKLMNMNLPQDIKSQVQLIGKSTKILMDEVNQLLDFKRLDDRQVQIHASYGNLATFVNDVCTAFTPEADHSGLQMDVHIRQTTIMTYFDHEKLQRILLNLLANAVKYNVKGGTIEVVLDTIMEKGGNMVLLTVSDTGIGIKDENKQRIFQRYFQETHETTYKGNGLGLYIVYEYVRLFGGTIKALDNKPQGTLFKVVFPINESGEKHLPAMVHGAEPPLSQHPGILIVEDNEDLRNYLKECLKDKYKVFDAENGKVALDILTSENIQLVISDVMMPEMDGIQLLQHIKTDINLSHIPVILLTAKSAEEHIIGGLKEGADDYISKPFNLEILMLRIEKLLQWSINNHEKFRTINISPKEITVSSLDEQLITKAIAVVEENMDNTEFSVEDLSAAVGMTRGHLYKKLMSITGKAPLEFIRILRLKRGKQLLDQSGENISQISWQIGLSPKQFSKYFKEEYGSLPSEYKTANSKDSAPSV